MRHPATLKTMPIQANYYYYIVCRTSCFKIFSVFLFCFSLQQFRTKRAARIRRTSWLKRTGCGRQEHLYTIDYKAYRNAKTDTDTSHVVEFHPLYHILVYHHLNSSGPTAIYSPSQRKNHYEQNHIISVTMCGYGYTRFDLRCIATDWQCTSTSVQAVRMSSVSTGFMDFCPEIQP